MSAMLSTPDPERVKVVQQGADGDRDEPGEEVCDLAAELRRPPIEAVEREQGRHEEQTKADVERKVPE